MSDIDAQLVELLPRWYADPLLFVKEAFAWGYGELEGEDGPDVWQAQFLTDLGNEVKRAEKEKGSIRMAVASGHGVGKQLCLKTPVPTPQGVREWGSLKPGDLVFGADGKPTSVVARFDYTDQPLYRITFDDGSSILAGDRKSVV